MKNKYYALNRLIFLISCRLLFVSQIAAQFTPAPTGEGLTAKIDEYMNAAAKVNNFSGSVLVARDGKPVFSRGYGMANIELGVPNSSETVFRLGSITKQFTAMGVIMLAEKGKISVDDAACNYLTDCPAAWRTLTVKNLLTHTAGIPNYTDLPGFTKTAVSPVTRTEMMALLRDKPLEFVPGENFAYSNSGYYLLGMTVEKVSGKTYADFLQENIFAPLGMTQTGYDVSARIIKNRAAGYARQGGIFVNAAYLDMTISYAASAMYWTVGDLLIWDQALYTEKLASRKTLDKIFTPFKNGYAYGWSIGEQFNRREISHGGGICGFATDISRFPDGKLTVTVLSNVQGAPAGRVSNNLAAIAFGAQYEIPKERREIAVAREILERYVGEYEFTALKIVIGITLENGKLFGQAGGQTKFALAAESETVFFFEGHQSANRIYKRRDRKNDGHDI